MNAINYVSLWNSICYYDIDIHFFIVWNDHLPKIKLTPPGIFGMAGVWHGASLPNLN